MTTGFTFNIPQVDTAQYRDPYTVHHDHDTLMDISSAKTACDSEKDCVGIIGWEYRNRNTLFSRRHANLPYMGGLPDSLTTVPRLSTPRQNVPSGAVGIAAGQTGVYTLSSPGGWHLLVCHFIVFASAPPTFSPLVTHINAVYLDYFSDELVSPAT